MTEHPIERYQRDIKISAAVAMAFVVILALLYLIDIKTGFSGKLVSFFIKGA